MISQKEKKIILWHKNNLSKRIIYFKSLEKAQTKGNILDFADLIIGKF